MGNFNGIIAGAAGHDVMSGNNPLIGIVLCVVVIAITALLLRLAKRY